MTDWLISIPIPIVKLLLVILTILLVICLGYLGYLFCKLWQGRDKLEAKDRFYIVQIIM